MKCIFVEIMLWLHFGGNAFVAIIMVVISYVLKKSREGVAGCEEIPRATFPLRACLVCAEWKAV